MVTKEVTENINTAKDKVKSLFLNSEVEAPILAYALLQELGGEHYAEFEPEILREWCADVPEENIQKIFAMRPCLFFDPVSSQHPSQDYVIFEKCCLAFNNREVNPLMAQEIFLSEILWAVEVIANSSHNILEEDSDSFAFSKEVAGWIAKSLFDQGLIVTPLQLAFCQDILDGMTMDLVTKDYVIEKLEKSRSGEYNPVNIGDNPVDYQVITTLKAEAEVEERKKKTNEAILRLNEIYNK